MILFAMLAAAVLDLGYRFWHMRYRTENEGFLPQFSANSVYQDPSVRMSRVLVVFMAQSILFGFFLDGTIRGAMETELDQRTFEFFGVALVMSFLFKKDLGRSFGEDLPGYWSLLNAMHSKADGTHSENPLTRGQLSNYFGKSDSSQNRETTEWHQLSKCEILLRAR